MNTQHIPAGSAGLFLRSDGSLMIAKAVTTLEMRLTPAQLLQLGVDCLRTAVALEPRCLTEVLQALDACTVQVPVDFAERAPCQPLN